MKLFEFLASAEASHIGQKRKRNEDSVLCVPEHGVFCLSDGMGGADAGDLASLATTSAVGRTLRERIPTDVPVSAEFKATIISQAVNAASAWIFRRAEERGVGASGATITVLVFDPTTPAAAIALHAGDSPMFLFRGGKLTTVTREHSFAAEAGYPNEADIPRQFRGLVTRAVGVKRSVQLERTNIDLREKDLILLCSDGLSKMVPPAGIKRLLSGHASEALSDLANRLVAEANRAGGLDNISVILVRIGTMQSVPSAEAPAVVGVTESIEPEAGDEAADDTPGSTDRHGQLTTDSTRRMTSAGASTLTGVDQPLLDTTPSPPMRGLRRVWRGWMGAVVGGVVLLLVILNNAITGKPEREREAALDLARQLAFIRAGDETTAAYVERSQAAHRNLKAWAARWPETAEFAELAQAVVDCLADTRDSTSFQFDVASEQGDLVRMEALALDWQMLVDCLSEEDASASGAAERAAAMISRREHLRKFQTALRGFVITDTRTDSLSEMLTAFRAMVENEASPSGADWLRPHEKAMYQAVRLWGLQRTSEFAAAWERRDWFGSRLALETIDVARTNPALSPMALSALTGVQNDMLQDAAVQWARALNEWAPDQGIDALRSLLDAAHQLHHFTSTNVAIMESLNKALSDLARRLASSVQTAQGAETIAALETLASFVEPLPLFSCRDVIALELHRVQELHEHQRREETERAALARARAVLVSARAALHNAPAGEWSGILRKVAAETLATSPALNEQWQALASQFHDEVKNAAQNLLDDSTSSSMGKAIYQAREMSLIDTPVENALSAAIRLTPEATMSVDRAPLRDRALSALPADWSSVLLELGGKRPEDVDAREWSALRSDLTNSIATAIAQAEASGQDWMTLSAVVDLLRGPPGVSALGPGVSESLVARWDRVPDRLLQAARISGQWGSLGTMLDKAGGEVVVFRQAAQREEYRTWRQAWEDARKAGMMRSSDSRAKWLHDWMQPMQKAAIKLRLPVQSTRLPLDRRSDDWPDFACQYRHQLETNFLAALQQRGDQVEMVLDAFGPQPRRQLDALWAFAASLDPAGAVAADVLASEIRGKLRDLHAQLSAAGAIPISEQRLDALAAPFAGRHGMDRKINAFWKTILVPIRLFAVRITERRAQETLDSKPLLDLIDQAARHLSQRPGGEPNSAASIDSMMLRQLFDGLNAFSALDEHSPQSIGKIPP